MRTITEHHDGHGLNESIGIIADERDAKNGGNGSHHYDFTASKGTAVHQVGFIQFQHGPRLDPKSRIGVTEAALYVVLIDRLEGFQAGPFACDENMQQIDLLKQCLALTKARADARAAAGILGKNEPMSSNEPIDTESSTIANDDIGAVPPELLESAS